MDCCGNVLVICCLSVQSADSSRISSLARDKEGIARLFVQTICNELVISVYRWHGMFYTDLSLLHEIKTRLTSRFTL